MICEKYSRLKILYIIVLYHFLHASNTDIYKLCKAVLSTLCNISQPKFAICKFRYVLHSCGNWHYANSPLKFLLINHKLSGWNIVSDVNECSSPCTFREWSRDHRKDGDPRNV